ncbi:hypothetical protein HPP92_013519 [Vanilla planifolia]|uniref:Pentatricopeptide repeat-containing protein n=1 Tax=Vanilla planifolia TaxID=51239 RepID=A0A835UWR8_VANPL|nr:hypothetical protein HPP92_013519 [Vanilla planifolia]
MKTLTFMQIRWGGIPSLPRALRTARKLLSTKSLPEAEASLKGPASTTVVVEKKNEIPLYRRLSSLGAAPEGSVTKTMNKWVREGRTVKVDQLIKYVKGLRKYRRYRHALELMNWMVEVRGMNLSHTNLAICLDLICKVRGIEPAEEFFNKLPDSAKNERTYGALFSCYCSKKMAEKANALFLKMEEINIASSTLLYNNLMSLFMKLGQPEKVPQIFQKMKANNIAPDNLTCCILMNSYAAKDDIEAVEGIIKEMEEEDEVTIQWTAYSTLAAIYNSVNLFDKAELALQKLELLINGHEREPFHFLISLYAGAGNLKQVRRVWELLKTTFPKQTNLSYLMMLHALNKFDDVHGMKKCFSEWESNLETYDLRIANLVVGAYLRKDMEKEAETVLDKVKEKGLSADLRTCDLFIDYYLKNGKIDLAKKWSEVAALTK